MGRAETVWGTDRSLLTSEQVAHKLHVSPRTVARLVSRGELRVVKLGRAVRFRPDDVAELVEAHLDDDPATTWALANFPLKEPADRGAT